MNTRTISFVVVRVSALLLVAATCLQDEALSEEQAKWVWCNALRDDPGLIYTSKENPWIQSIELGGRLHYQVAHVDGEGVRGQTFNDDYDEYRRLRLKAEVEFLRILKAEVSNNLVDDRRFRENAPRELDWGHQDFDTLTLELDIDRALGLEIVDKLELTYGRMKLQVGEELHQSSRQILTIERSSLSGQIGSEDSRPTGAVLAVGKDNWDLSFGVFSTDDDASGLASWNAGQLYYMSVEWEPGDFRFVYDHVINDPSGDDFGTGYDWVGSLSGSYDGGRWGLMVNGAYGNNGGLEHGRDLVRRQGDYYGVLAMPWYWIVEDRLQLVISYEWMKAEQSQGIRIDSRYIRAHHDNPDIDVDGGRGDCSQVFYLGLNYHLCDQNAKIMAGISQTELDGRQGNLAATSYILAFRTYF